jgi:uncharacterized OB-fold protein
MAKKTAKRAAPTRKCEECGTSYHPRRKDCPKCGAANPTAGRPRKRRKKVTRRNAASSRRSASRNHPIDAAIRFVEEAGGMNAATAALETIRRIKTL